MAAEHSLSPWRTARDREDSDVHTTSIAAPFDVEELLDLRQLVSEEQTVHAFLRRS